ncbi:hypothetical protein ACIBXA_03345 [Micromonospora echinaurantiaca]|uniref:hypothetical protein n=1 Tax=Micromonospora TaxID=1873 RepID=UPI000D6F633B|nr:hypothetical protein [Micromonospora sp. S4605]PWU56176.1 hypothetical protein DLJ47_07070 [Micromonospora sp. S4605]
MVGRVLELRVHGVSNTPPHQTLGLRGEAGAEPPRPWLVAGGPITGFYRSTATGPDDPVVVEAYSWGQLTSGARTARDVERALWTLLLPFTLANVALHARPEIPAEPDTERWRSRTGLTAWLIRLFCLSMTGTLMLTLSGVGVDLIGWQCVDRECLARAPGPWEFLAHGWWREGARSLAVGLVVPLGLLTVLGLVAWRTYQYEAEMPAAPTGPVTGRAPAEAPADGPPGVPPTVAQPETAPPPPEPPPTRPVNPLQDPTFWSGEGQLRRAGLLHLCTGATVAAAVPLGAVLAMDPPRGPRAVVAGTTVACLATVLLCTVVVLGRPWLTRRAGHTPLGRLSGGLIVLTGLGLAGTVLLLLLPDGPAGTPLAALRPPAGCARDPAGPGCAADRSLPGFDWVIAWLGTGQLLLLIAIGAVSRSGRRALAAPLAAGLLLPLGVGWISGWLPGLPAAPRQLEIWLVALVAIVLAGTGLLLPRTRSAVDIQPLAAHTDLAWGGRGPAVIAGFGWVLCISYSGGLLYWVTDRLDTAPSGGPPTVVPPVPVMWAGLAFAVALLALAGTVAVAGLRFYRLRRQEYAALVPPGHALSGHDLRRGRDVSTFRALHRLVGEHGLRLVGGYAVAAAVLVTLGCAAVLTRSPPHPATATGGAAVVRAVADAGDALLGWLPALVATVGLLVYRNDTVRRTVGVVWDVGTFWPRAAHPLAPPSYAERAVPELQTRTAGLLALAPNDHHRMDGIILSGHSQGTVLCAAVILQLPARWRRRIWFFSYGCQLTRLYGRVFPAYFGPDRLPALAEALRRPGGGTGWTNFWRNTDPLGWPVTAGERDVAVRDPEALHPSAGEVADPPIRNHSGYPESSEFHRERSRVAWLLRQAVPSPRRGFG